MSLKKLTDRVLSGVLTGAMVLSTVLGTVLPTAVNVAAQQSETQGGTVYISISDDDAYIYSDTTEHNGELMCYVPIDLNTVAQSIDLEDYGYADYEYDTDEDGIPETTLFYVFLYVLEHYYSDGVSSLNVTGSAGSTYLQYGFFGHDENLTYYVNGQYPLDAPAWGATSDHIVMHDGDFIDVSMYSDWGFWTEQNAGYHYFLDDYNGNIVHEYQVQAGCGLPIYYGLARTDWNNTYNTIYESWDSDIYYGTELYGDDASVIETDGGHANLVFEEPGTYYLWAYGQEGANGTIISAPAYAKVLVSPAPEVEPDPEPEITSAEVTIRSQAYNSYLNAFDQTVTVSSDKAESYGYTDSVIGAVSALDVLVAAHEGIFQEDFTSETAAEYLAVSSSGFVTALFGEQTMANGFLINNGYPNDGTESSWGGYNGTTVTTQAVADGDVVDFVLYGDSEYYSDSYSFVTVDGPVYAGQSFPVTVTGTMFMMGYMYQTPEDFAEAAEPMEAAGLAWVDPTTGEVVPIDGLAADENGQAVVTAPEETGTYYLTAISSEDMEVAILMNPTEIIVENEPVPVTSAQVTVRSQMYNSYLTGFEEAITVASDKAESYGYSDSIPGQVSALDVLVAAHEQVFGDDFTAETAGEYLAVGSSGFVNVLFGVETMANGFLINNGYPNDGTESSWGGYNGTTVSTQAVADGDLVDFFVYTDDSYYSDYYSFITTSAPVYAGAPFTATVYGTMVMMGYMYQTPDAFAAAAETLEDAGLAWVDPSTGEISMVGDLLTDENGQAVLTAPEEAGTYYLTAISSEEDEVYVLMNPSAVTVEEAPDVVSVETTITMNNTSSSAKLYAISDTEKANDLLAGVALDGKKYSTALNTGDYVLEVFGTDGTTSNGTIVLNVTEENHDFVVYTVTAYCTTSGWVYGTDYTIENLKVLSGGEKATVVREVTMGQSVSEGSVCFPVLNGDTYSFYGTPTEVRAEEYTATYKTGTVTGDSYATASFTMAAKAGLSVSIPYADENADGQNDYILEVGQMTNYYIYTYLDPVTDDVDAENATETTSYDVAKSGAYYYRVTNPLNSDAVTYGNYLTTSAAANTVTVSKADLFVDSSDYDKNTVLRDFSVNAYDTGDIYLNINEKGYLSLTAGESYNLYPFRNWLAIEGINNAKVIEPDFHVEVINVEGNCISVNEKLENTPSKHSYEIKANAPGTAIVLVTYDAMTHAAAMGAGKQFSAIWPENTGVFVVTVNAANGVQTGMTINEGMNLTGKLVGDAYDADHDVLYYEGSAGASYTFKPEEGTNVTMAVGQISGGKLSFGSFSDQGVALNEDGSITLSGLTEGKTIVRLINNGRVEYQVLKAKHVDVTVKKGDAVVYTTASSWAEDAEIKAGDTLTLVFDTIYHPANKLSGIYNMAGSIHLTGEDGTAKAGTANQYLFAATAACHQVTIQIPKYWSRDTYKVNGTAFSSGFGSQYGFHRILTYEAGKAPNFTAGSYAAAFGALPTLEIPLAETVFLPGTLNFQDQNGNPVASENLVITMTDKDGAPVLVNADGTFLTLAGTYDLVVKAEGYEYKLDTVTLTEDGENVFTIVLQTASEGAWDGVSKSQPAQDEDGTYLISTGAELAWFQDAVTVQKTRGLNAKLVADINLANYPWTPIGTTSNQMDGIFDGNGHEVYNMYCKGTGSLALFGTITGTVKDLTVSGKVVGTSGNLAGIAAYAQGKNASTPCQIINCVNNVDVTYMNASSGSNASVGGIAGYTYYAQIENCVNNGTISTNNTGAASAFGGIVGYAMNYAPSYVKNCINLGDVSGRAKTGGIIGQVGGSNFIVETCYNKGNITGTSYVGGIVGDLTGAALSRCYSVGTVTGNSDTVCAVAADSSSKNKLTDCYYLSDSEAKGAGTAVTADFLKGVHLEGFGTVCDDDYPALLWEDRTFHVRPESGVVTAPTCIEVGYTTYTCPNCQRGFTDDYVPANGHTLEVAEHHAAYDIGTCSVCGEALTVWVDERFAIMELEDSLIDAVSMTDTTEMGWKANADTKELYSGNIGVNSSTSATEFTVTLNKYAHVSFEYGVSSEARYDKLTLSVVNAAGETEVLANAISGTEDGTFDRYLPAGTYKFIGSFYKDSSSASGRDLGYIRNFKVEGIEGIQITEQPADVTMKPDENAVFTVSAIAGSELSYQWWYYNTKTGKWSKTTATGAATDTLTIKATTARDNYKYRCVVSDADGNSVTTEEAVLRVILSYVPEINPDVEVRAGENATYHVTTVAEAAAYKWYYYNAGTGKRSATTMSGYDTDTLTVPATTQRDGYKYYCQVTYADGTVAQSAESALIIKTDRDVAVSGDVTAAAGTTVQFTVTTDKEVESYQWYYYNTHTGKWSRTTMEGNTTNTVTVPVTEARDGYKYRCLITFTDGTTETSEESTLTVG